MDKLSVIGRIYVFKNLAAIVSVAALMAIAGNDAIAQPVKVGRTVGGSGFHIPSYVAIDKGFLKAEGLDANFIAATAGVLVRATIAKEIEVHPHTRRRFGSNAQRRAAGIFRGRIFGLTMDADHDAGHQTS